MTDQTDPHPGVVHPHDCACVKCSGLSPGHTVFTSERGKRLICLRCGYGSDPAKPWIQRGDLRPRQCWKCRTPYWDRTRTTLKKIIPILVFIVSWHVSIRRPAPCPMPTPDAWGAYHYSPGYEQEMKMILSFCTDEISTWKTAAFATRKEFEAFIATRPSEVDHLTWFELDDRGRVVKKSR